MPVHDWTRVSAGIFQAFHTTWLVDLSRALNSGLLPPGFYALPEQDAGPAGPDVLTLHAPSSPSTTVGGPGGLATLGPPRARFSAVLPQSLKRPRFLTIRHSSVDRVVAMIEVVSPGNKSGEHPIRTFLEKLAQALREGVNLLVIDLFPPTPRDPRGLHSAFWEYLGGEPFLAPAEEPLTLAAYEASSSPAAYIETTAVGRILPDMPLILAPDEAVPVPLERTYQLAYDGLPARSKAPLEAGA
jgi:hypothetical protein